VNLILWGWLEYDFFDFWGDTLLYRHFRDRDHREDTKYVLSRSRVIYISRVGGRGAVSSVSMGPGPVSSSPRGRGPTSSMSESSAKREGVGAP